ncbi:MAG TPA: hypothetical protein VEV42_02005 [Pyrinomonadaceae bacterium]|nr:hypothetical protein [Pyrinomonadaceae bacterium]
MKEEVTADDRAKALLRVASYLGRPQKFMPVGNARAEMRHTLELVAKGSVILTTHGEPAAAVVPFTTLEDMRRALLHLLVEQMGATFERSQEKARSQGALATSQEELEALVRQAVKKARKRGKSHRKMTRG